MRVTKILRAMAAWLDQNNERMRGPAAPELSAESRPDPANTLRALGFQCEAGSGEWCCNQCNRMQADASAMVWVPDEVGPRDDLGSVLHALKRGTWNGHSSAWCVRCASGFLSRGDVEGAIRARQEKLAASRVKRLAECGEGAEKNPSHTRCAECDAVAGYISLCCATFGGSYAGVMCPCCGWEGWEKTSDRGITIVAEREW